MIALGLPPGPIEILCLGAHPDDIEIACGGLLLELGDQREVRATVATLTGSLERRDEAREIGRASCRERVF